MKDAEELLREYIELVTEKAVTPAEARKQKLALYVGKSVMSGQSADRTYILYDVNKLADIVNKTKNTDNAMYRKFSDAVVAAIAVRSNLPIGMNAWGASEIEFSAAEQGYGPLLYDIVMKEEEGLISDRDSVSSAAKGVWKYYKNNRSDVEAKPLDNMLSPETPTKKDDAIVFDGGKKNPLNYAYFLKGGGPAVTMLKNNHAAFMKTQPSIKGGRLCGRSFIAGSSASATWKYCTKVKGHKGNHGFETKKISDAKISNRDFDEIADEFFHKKYG